MFRSHGRATLRGAFLAVLLLITSLMFAGGALAVSGKPLKIAEPVRYGNPAVSVDSSGTAYVAWANRTDLKEEGDKIEYCVLPAGAVACAHSGTLIAEGGKAPVVGQVQVIVDGATVVLLAEVYGVGQEYEPVQEWRRPMAGRRSHRWTASSRWPTANSAPTPEPSTRSWCLEPMRSAMPSCRRADRRRSMSSHSNHLRNARA